jgi:hypothetical protein
MAKAFCYRKVISTAIYFLLFIKAYNQQTVQVIGNLKGVSDSCKCLHFINRDRKAVSINMTKHRWQNLIRDNYKTRGDLEKKMVENFFWKCGDYRLSTPEFNQLTKHAYQYWPSVTDSSSFFAGKEKYTLKTISFYNNPLFDFAIGNGLVIANESGKIVGFYDYYDFPKTSFIKKGRRKFMAELITRIMRMYRKKNKPFALHYGIIPNNK